MAFMIATMLSVATALGITGKNFNNVALGKPSYQSSVYSYQKNSNERHNGDAWRAVDGNKDTAYTQGSCMHTEEEWNPWWVVDLRSLHLISHVEITSADFVAQELRNFTIDISSYMEGGPHNGVLIKPVLCHYRTTAQASSTTEAYGCPVDVMGRYVRVMIHATDNIHPLYFCELAVYATDMERVFEIIYRPSKRSLNSSVGVFRVSSVLHCFILCQKYRPCTSFNLHQTTAAEKTCELIADPVPWVSNNEAEVTDWAHYFTKMAVSYMGGWKSMKEKWSSPNTRLEKWTHEHGERFHKFHFHKRD